MTADQYPYIASSTSLRATLVPTKYREGTDKEFVARLDDPETRATDQGRRREGARRDATAAKRIQIARYAPNPKWQGKNVAAIAEAEKKEPIDIVLEIERNGGAQIVNFGMSEDDVRVYMKQPWVATASDGGVQTPGATVPHPRSYGTFPRKIGCYAIEEKLIPVEARDPQRDRFAGRHPQTDRPRLPEDLATSRTWWCSTRRRSTTRPRSRSRTSTRPA